MCTEPTDERQAAFLELTSRKHKAFQAIIRKYNKISTRIMHAIIMMTYWYFQPTITSGFF